MPNRQSNCGIIWIQLIYKVLLWKYRKWNNREIQIFPAKFYQYQPDSTKNWVKWKVKRHFKCVVKHIIVYILNIYNVRILDSSTVSQAHITIFCKYIDFTWLSREFQLWSLMNYALFKNGDRMAEGNIPTTTSKKRRCNVSIQSNFFEFFNYIETIKFWCSSSTYCFLELFCIKKNFSWALDPYSEWKTFSFSEKVRAIDFHKWSINYHC